MHVSCSSVYCRALMAIIALLTPPLSVHGLPRMDPHEYLLELRRVAARKPFLTDSPDVYLEPKSLNRFFTGGIYKKLLGNAYVGYEYDEGLLLLGNTVQLEVLKDLTPERSCKPAFRLALEQSFNAAGFEIKSTAPHQIGICIVGMEPLETPSTLAGIMVEATDDRSDLIDLKFYDGQSLYFSLIESAAP